MRCIPHIIEDDEATLVLELLREMEGGVFLIDKTWILAGQRGIQFCEAGLNLRCLAQSDPQNTIIKGSKNIIVMAQRRRKGRLS